MDVSSGQRETFDVGEPQTHPSGTTSAVNDPPRPDVGWIGNQVARLARIGADARDDEDLRQKKALLVLVAVVILPVSIAWGVLYLGLGSPVGVAPLVYAVISLASLVAFARTRRFQVFLVIQLADILLAPTLGGQMLVGGFLTSGAVGLWGILAPLGALVFCELRVALRWFGAFVAVFVLTGIAGEVLISDADLPEWFIGTMLALNVIGVASIAFTLLASFVGQRNAALAALRAEQEQAEALLLNVLPRPIAERLKADAHTIADDIDEATILFADIVDFTPLAERLPAVEMVGILDELFSQFDVLVDRHGLEKIKTIGDCYMAAAGVPMASPDHAHAAARLALDMRDVIPTIGSAGRHGLEVRIGINSGPVVAGVIGTKRFLYDLWGDAVNMASRMESHGTPGEIQITRATYDRLRDRFDCRPRGPILVKGKGEVETWYLVGPLPDAAATHARESAGAEHALEAGEAEVEGGAEASALAGGDEVDDEPGEHRLQQ